MLLVCYTLDDSATSQFGCQQYLGVLPSGPLTEQTGSAQTQPQRSSPVSMLYLTTNPAVQSRKDSSSRK